jgi:kynureninase
MRELFDFENTLEYAKSLDQKDNLSQFRDQFYLPTDKQGNTLIYFCGNSLGLQPRNVKDYVLQELKDWELLGVEGHVHARRPWMPYNELLTESMAKIVGALSEEVVVMNSLTVNLHLMMVSFYQPTEKRHKVLMEYHPFPSDRYAVESQIRFHGFDPQESLIELKPKQGTEYIEFTQIEDVLSTHGDEIAMVLIGNVNYYSGQAYSIKKITELAHNKGCMVGFDLAHGVGNLILNLHDAGPDFAVWCTYKYLNSGPGGMSGVFVHQRYADSSGLPRFNGWWGHNKEIRFQMGPNFKSLPGAEGWQLSNPPILPMAALRASLDLFDQAGMCALREKSERLTRFLEHLLVGEKQDQFRIITPANANERGCQLSIQVKGGDRRLFEKITRMGVIADWREPDVIRVAPVPLYNTFEEVWRFAKILKSCTSD